eukprot:CAMPEP_0172456090 /NCGR_PEP_ID=MMETSP1065-20121228/14180_1 /TAXON_ID=265537 /ORGANISM="Amphiprora paludosa, Strain CCMP125" /LENGTH=450 /DNA_ID=CAMNT_0013208761 /DNA_START=177 /DNA_END=1529 /DNA_ORIENTATION=+
MRRDELSSARTMEDLDIFPSKSSDSISSATTLRTAEETWIEDYCESDDFLSSLSSLSSFSTNEASERKTIDPQLPKPARRHRRNVSALPRLQTTRELPPLPPKRSPDSSSNGPLRKHALSMDSADSRNRASLRSSRSNKPKRRHRRNSSAPVLVVAKKESSSMDALSAQLDQLQKLHGVGDSRVAPVWNLIGNARFRDGHHRAAVQAYEQAIKCEPGPHLVDSYCNMGTVFWAMGKVEDSLKQFKIALGAVIEGENLQVADIQYQIGLAYTLLKKYDEALVSLKQAGKIRCDIEGSKHPDFARTLDAIGKVHTLQGNFKSALSCYQEALSIRQGLPFSDDRSKGSAVLTSLQNIAILHKTSGSVDQAILAYGAVHAEQKEQLVTGAAPASIKKDIAETLIALADLFKLRKMASKSCSCLREADSVLVEMGYSPSSPLRALVADKFLSSST